LASDDATIALCGPCRHFELALAGPHRCQLGLPLRVEGMECARFDPFAVGEGSMFEQSDCCAGEGHAHASARATERA
jgi:hypothetical protein